MALNFITGSLLMKHKPYSHILITSFAVISLIFTADFYLHADTVLSDPDHISTGIEYRGTPAARIGDSFRYYDFSFNGMAEIRNEERFNNRALPNHNWRGFVSLYYSLPFQSGDKMMTVTTGFEHESSHPTMGFNDGNDRAYDRIYDGTYRNTNLNSLLLRLKSTGGDNYKATLLCDAQFYLFSRNTPELPVNDLTWSEGLSAGIEFLHPVSGGIDFYLSGFDRYIFESVKKTEGDIYYDTGSGTETRHKNYPVINNTNTVSARTGIIFNSIIPGRKLSLYCGVLYGNIYGFVDSREKRTVYSAGIEIY